MRKSFTMTEGQHAALIDASKPTPAMYLTGGAPMFGTPQENANRAWEQLGAELGFNHMTARPAGDDPRKFTAEEAP